MTKGDSINGFLFLDIDGVIYTHKAHIAAGNYGGLMETPDRDAINLINQFCENFQFQIVLSSTKRFAKNLIPTLKNQGLEYFYDEDPLTPKRGYKKGLEIQDFLDNHKDICQNFVIVDDESSDFLDHQKPWHIASNTFNGMDILSYLDVWTRLAERGLGLSKTFSKGQKPCP